MFGKTVYKKISNLESANEALSRRNEYLEKEIGELRGRLGELGELHSLNEKDRNAVKARDENRSRGAALRRDVSDSSLIMVAALDGSGEIAQERQEQIIVVEPTHGSIETDAARPNNSGGLSGGYDSSSSSSDSASCDGGGCV